MVASQGMHTRQAGHAEEHDQHDAKDGAAGEAAVGVQHEERGDFRHGGRSGDDVRGARVEAVQAVQAAGGRLRGQRKAVRRAGEVVPLHLQHSIDFKAAAGGRACTACIPCHGERMSLQFILAGRHSGV
jgi:hypothetical protein